MANPYVNKVIVNDQIKLDLTGDTVSPETLLQGFTAHDASGAPIVGTATGGDACDMYAGNEAPSGASSGDLWVDTADENAGTIVYNPAMGKVNSTTYTNVCQVTVPATGIYKATWQHYSSANSQQYYMTQLYVGNTATGSVHYPTTYSTAPTACVENNLSLTAGQAVSVRAKSRSGSYFTMAGCLVLEKVG